MKTIFLFLITFLFFQPTFSKEKKCHWDFQKEKTKVQWTAFKYTNKTGVKGQFKKWSVTSPKKTSSFNDFLKSIDFKIQADSIDTGNPDRDKNINTNFFSLLKGQIHGKVTQVKGGENQGFVTVLISMNDVNQKITMTYSKNKNLFQAKGRLDILNFKATNAFHALHKACEKLHTGKDGQSKTWSDVELFIESEIQCH